MKKIKTKNTVLTVMLSAFCGLSNVANAQWDTLAKPAEFYPAVYVTTHNSQLYCAGNFGVYSYNSGTWSDLTQGTFQSGINANNEIVFAGSFIYMRSTVNGIYRSPDNGTTWEMDTVGLSAGEPFSLFFDGTNVFTSKGWAGINGYGFFRKQPSDNSWTQITEIGNDNAIVWGLTKKGNDLYAAVSNGCWVSSDNGQTWTKKTSINFPNINTTWSYVEAGNRFITHNGALYFGSDNGVHKSTDNGDSWTRIDVNFQEYLGKARIPALYSDGTTLYAATRETKSAYKSDDDGQTWADISNGLDGNVVSFASLNGTVYATLFGKSNVYFMGGGSTGISSLSKNEFDIYPNPANDFVTISNVPIPIGSTVNITDITGKIVYSSVINNEQTTISTTEFVNGIYIVQITNNGAVATRKLVVNK